MSKAADRSSSDKTDTEPLSEAEHLLHATRRSQCCDTFGRQTGTVLEDCETAYAAKTVSGQYAAVPLTRMANWNRPVVFHAVWIKTGGFFNRGLTRACLKHCGTIPDDKDLFMMLVTIGIISSRQS